MKCPKCNFVSFPGIQRCKKCGYRFIEIPQESDDAPSLFNAPPDESTLDDVSFGKPHEGSSELTGASREIDGPLTGTKDTPITPSDPEFSEPPFNMQDLGSDVNWQEEVSKRLGEFRRRRASLQKDQPGADESSLKLDFEPSIPTVAEARRKVIEFPLREADSSRHELSLTPESPSAPPVLDNILTGFGTKSGNSSDREVSSTPPSEKGPMEIELTSSKLGATLFVEEEILAPKVAPISQRFVAGAIDSVALLVAAGVFAVIFRQAGGRLSTSPLDLLVVAFIACFLIALYFGASAAFASASPGLIWAGLEVRTFEGNPPKKSDCFWRALGYIVSISALMLGFIWALVDGDGLTWHDRMSRTFLVTAKKNAGALETTTTA